MPKSPTTSSESPSEAERLKAKRRALDEALGEFLHEGRRVRDALERVGGQSHVLEQKAKLLAKNARRTEQELADCDAALAALAPKTD